MSSVFVFFFFQTRTSLRKLGFMSYFLAFLCIFCRLSLVASGIAGELLVGQTDLWNDCQQGSFPAGTPGNGIPKVILVVGTAFPGKPLVIRYIFVNEPYRIRYLNQL